MIWIVNMSSLNLCLQGSSTQIWPFAKSWQFSFTIPLLICFFLFHTTTSQFRSSQFISAWGQPPALDPATSLLNSLHCLQIQPLKHNFYIVFCSKKEHRSVTPCVFRIRSRILWLEILTYFQTRAINTGGRKPQIHLFFFHLKSCFICALLLGFFSRLFHPNPIHPQWPSPIPRPP